MGACFADSFDLEQMVSDICYIYRIERQFKADGVYLYRNATLDEPSAIAATIENDELAVTDTAANGIMYAISTTYLDSSNEITKVAFNFLDADNDFKPNQLTAKSPLAVQTDAEKQVTLPFVMTVADAETLVNRLVVADRLSLIQHNFRLPPKYGWLGKGDVIVINHGIFSDTVRIKQTDFNADKSQSVVAQTVASATTPVAGKPYSSNRTAVGGPLVNSEPLFFDIPTLDPAEGTGDGITDQFEMYHAVIPKASGFWLGAYLARQLTKDSEAYAVLFHSYGKNAAGSFINRWRATNSLSNKRWITDTDTLALAAGNADWITSRNVDKAAIDADARINLALYGDVGRWEIIQFEKIIDGVMSGIVRGLRGTEWACGLHQANDYVYTLAPNLTLTRLAKTYIGSTAKYRAVTEGAQFILADQVQAPAFVGNSRKPFAPYHFRGTRGDDGAITFTWLRRDRGGNAWGHALPMSETVLGYEVDVCSSSGAVLRTTACATESFVYTSAMQASDGTAADLHYYLTIRQQGDVAMGFNGSEQVNV